MGIIVAALFVVFVVAALCYLVVKLKSRSKTGRSVEVRVLSCEQKGENQNRLYYEMQVDFYDANGEVLARTMQSAKKYMPGEMIRCRYLEQTGLLFEEMTPEVKKKSMNNILLFLVLVIIFVGIVVAVMVNGGVPKEADILIVYGISILFMLTGVYGILHKNRTRQEMQNMISLPGMQVDYTITQNRKRMGKRIYHPIYEYEWGGERRRIGSHVGGSRQKYCSIGRKVHIFVDPHTGKALCAEDTKTSENMFLGFGIIGIVVFLLLLGRSFGVLS